MKKNSTQKRNYFQQEHEDLLEYKTLASIKQCPMHVCVCVRDNVQMKRRDPLTVAKRTVETAYKPS